MTQAYVGVALGALAVLLVVYLALRARWGAPPPRMSTDVRRELERLKAQARAPGLSNDDRAKAWRDVAQYALTTAGRPRHAAAYAARAMKVGGPHVEAIAVFAAALRRARRYRALEARLWRMLAREADVTSPIASALFVELEGLYAGPMRRTDRAKVLAALRAR